MNGNQTAQPIPEKVPAPEQGNVAPEKATEKPTSFEQVVPAQKPKAQPSQPVVLSDVNVPNITSQQKSSVDIKQIEQVITDIVNKYDYVKFLYGGGRQIKTNIGVNFFNGIPISKKIILPRVEMNKYPEMIENIDIGIAPLVDTEFNRSKSNLKYLEYSALGIPSVCSNVYPYAKTIKKGENGFLAKNIKHWKEHLERLIESSSLRKEIGEASYNFVKENYNQKDIAKQWAKLLKGEL